MCNLLVVVFVAPIATGGVKLLLLLFLCWVVCGWFVGGADGVALLYIDVICAS